MTDNTYEISLQIMENPSLCLNRQQMIHWSWLL